MRFAHVKSTSVWSGIIGHQNSSFWLELIWMHTLWNLKEIQVVNRNCKRRQYNKVKKNRKFVYITKPGFRAISCLSLTLSKFCNLCLYLSDKNNWSVLNSKNKQYFSNKIIDGATCVGVHLSLTNATSKVHCVTHIFGGSLLY